MSFLNEHDNKQINPKPHDRNLSNYGFGPPLLFILSILILVINWEWPRKWLLSGVPFLQLALLMGESQGYRFLPNWKLWSLFTTLHLIYGICSTSWLLYWSFTLACYISVFSICLFQFQRMGETIRKALRVKLKSLHFVDDKIASFHLPAIEIDLEVIGIFIARGFTFSFRNISIIFHSIEIGIKLNQDIEIAFLAGSLCVNLFRNIEISDCYVNIKAGKYEMTFGHLENKTKSVDDNSVLVEDTPLLVAASRESDQRSFEGSSANDIKTNVIDRKPVPNSQKSPTTKNVSLGDLEARDNYMKILKFFEHTDPANDAHRHIKQVKVDDENPEQSFDVSDNNAIRAAICSELHSHPSISHPPSKSIKMSSIKDLIPPRARKFIHRLPLLHRLILGPLSYFHPIKINSVTTTVSGQFLDSLIVSKVFKSYGDTNTEIRILKDRISAWLSEANFAIELSCISGALQVPLLSPNNIILSLDSEDVLAYRSLPGPVHLGQVARLGGADARFEIPIFLLPHHEHLLPPLPTEKEKQRLSRNVDQADGRPKEVQAKISFSKVLKDETNAKISFHARLPALFDQDLLNFVVALLKASKIVEIERESEANTNVDVNTTNDEVGGIRELTLNWKDVKKSLKKSLVDGVVNERWIVKLVGKITAKLELAHGEAGYSGKLPIKLENFRTSFLESEGEKLLP